MLDIFGLFVTIIIAVDLGQPEMAEATTCCLTKKVGGVTYDLISHRDTSSYNCLTDCVYRTSELGSLYCFSGGTEESECITTTTATTSPTTTTTTTSTTSIPTTTTSAISSEGEITAIASTSTVTSRKIVSGILITGGHGAENCTEVFMPDTGRTCSFPTIPDNGRIRHTMDTVNNIPVICGDCNNVQSAKLDCLQLSPVSAYGAWTHYATTLYKRCDIGSWVSSAGLVLMGGWPSGTTSEIVPNGGRNFSLVHTTRGGLCSIGLKDSVILTGGAFTNNKAVLQYNLQGHLEDLPDLNQGRYGHGCGWYQAGDDIVLVVAAGRDNGEYFSSTEKLTMGGKSWTFSMPLPHTMASVAAVSIGNKIILTGGSIPDHGGIPIDDVMSFDGEEWKELGKLMVARSSHAATKIETTDVNGFCG